MPVNYAQLKTELQTDPTAIGYAPMLSAGDHAGVAAALNLVRQTITIRRDILPAHELFECVVTAEYNSLTASEKSRLDTILGMGTVNVKGDNTRSQLSAMFVAGTATRTNMLAIMDRKGSRAEQLFGLSTKVAPSDIALALAS